MTNYRVYEVVESHVCKRGHQMERTIADKFYCRYCRINRRPTLVGNLYRAFMATGRFTPRKAYAKARELVG